MHLDLCKCEQGCLRQTHVLTDLFGHHAEQELAIISVSLCTQICFGGSLLFLQQKTRKNKKHLKTLNILSISPSLQREKRTYGSSAIGSSTVDHCTSRPSGLVSQFLQLAISFLFLALPPLLGPGEGNAFPVVSPSTNNIFRSPILFSHLHAEERGRSTIFARFGLRQYTSMHG